VLRFFLLVLLMTIVAIVAYQWLINKYYWGPKGPPKDDQKK